VVVVAGIGNDLRVNFIGKLIYRLLTLILAIPISKAIKKLIAQGWTAARPNDPPKDPKKADVGWTDALIWAVISGTGTALGKLLTSKGAAGTWRAIIGTEPPGFEKDPEKQKAI
jgi:Protein of unknown function (DUF4235)